MPNNLEKMAGLDPSEATINVSEVLRQDKLKSPAELLERIKVLEIIINSQYAEHLEKAERANFKQCGCNFCEATRKLQEMK